MSNEPTHSNWLNLTSSGRPLNADQDFAGSYTVQEASAAVDTVAGIPQIPGYEILRELGCGGMGIVYLARHLQLGRLVAIKVLRLAAQGPAERARFQTEAQAVAQLQHPNIVQIHEVGEQQGIAYLVLEYVDGGTLSQIVGGKPQPARESARLVRVLAEAMAFAHDRGILHRDLKPANILLSAGNSQLTLADRTVPAASTGGGPNEALAPKIADFGLAKRFLEQDSHTKTGDVVGTPSYMAPEQAAAKQQVGPAVDIYALGAMLYELLTGRPPFQGLTPMDTLLQVLSSEPISPRQLVPSVPKDLETICLKCLEKEPSKRYASAHQLAADLGHFLESRPISARPVGRPERAVRWCRRNPLVASLAVAAVVFALLAVASGFVLLWRFHHEEQAALREAVEAEKAAAEMRQEARLAQQEARQWLAQAEATNQWALWTKALEAARRAQAEYAKLAEAGAEARELAELLPRLAAGEAAAARAEKDQRMLEKLEQIAADRSDQGRQRLRESESNSHYAQAFRTYGIDVEKLPASEAVRLINGSRIKRRLVDSLDDWALIRYEERDATPERWRKLTELAMAVDTDRFRNQLRRAMLTKDVEAYLELSNQADAQRLGDRALFLLGRLLWLHHRNEEAMRFIEAAIVRDPKEVHYYFLINRLLREQQPVPWKKLLRYQAATLALRPQAIIRRNMATTLENLGHAELALEHREVAARQNRDPLNVSFELAAAYRHRRRYREAAEAYRHVVEQQPDFRNAQYRLAEMLARQGDFTAAKAEAQRGLIDARQRKDCETLLALLTRQDKLLKIFSENQSGSQFTQPADRLILALALRCRGQDQEAWQQFEQLRTLHPKEWNQLAPKYRQEAANAALVASRTLVDSSSRTKARIFAYAEMQASLQVLQAGLDDPETYDSCRETLARWCMDGELAVVRDPALRAQLPEAERTDWTELWTRVFDLLASR